MSKKTEYNLKYYHENKARADKWRLTTYANKLRKEGYLVLSPEEIEERKRELAEQGVIIDDFSKVVSPQ